MEKPNKITFDYLSNFKPSEFEEAIEKFKSDRGCLVLLPSLDPPCSHSITPTRQLDNCKNCGANSWNRNRCEYCGTQIENSSGIVTIVSEIEKQKPTPPASRYIRN